MCTSHLFLIINKLTKYIWIVCTGIYILWSITLIQVWSRKFFPLLLCWMCYGGTEYCLWGGGGWYKLNNGQLCNDFNGNEKHSLEDLPGLELSSGIWKRGCWKIVSYLSYTASTVLKNLKGLGHDIEYSFFDKSCRSSGISEDGSPMNYCIFHF